MLRPLGIEHALHRWCGELSLLSLLVLSSTILFLLASLVLISLLLWVSLLSLSLSLSFILCFFLRPYAMPPTHRNGFERVRRGRSWSAQTEASHVAGGCSELAWAITSKSRRIIVFVVIILLLLLLLSLILLIIILHYCCYHYYDYSNQLCLAQCKGRRRRAANE